MYDLPTVLLLFLLFVCACGFLLRKRRPVHPTHDVFLSFRGPDTRAGFVGGLYKSLVDAGLDVFRDDDSMQVGKPISNELLQAIRSCRIAIPIISKQFAESKWCLGELTEIMVCHKNYGKSVLPVFYDVNVLDLHGPGGDFEKALVKHEAEGCRQVPEWKEALRSVAWIRGWTSRTIDNGSETELAKIVVAKVSSELKTIWIERLPIFPKLMSNYHIRSAYGYFSDIKRGEVFLAFRGHETRRTFAACLYNSLVKAGIKVFKDDDPSLVGINLALGISNAISHCKISIPILSPDYVTSPWCLNDLVEMVDRKRRNGQNLLPIFYKVKPAHVKKVSHSIGVKMLQHKQRAEESQYKRWEQALHDVGSSKGWESEKIGDDGVLVEKVVEEVLKLLTNPRKHRYSFSSVTTHF